MLGKELVELIDWLIEEEIEYVCHWTDSQVWWVETKEYNYYINYLDIVDEIQAA